MFLSVTQCQVSSVAIKYRDAEPRWLACDSTHRVVLVSTCIALNGLRLSPRVLLAQLAHRRKRRHRLDDPPVGLANQRMLLEEPAVALYSVRPIVPCAVSPIST